MAIDSQTAIMNRHDYEETLTVEYDNDQSGGVILTPGAGKTLKVVGALISTEGTTGSVRVHFDDDEDDQVNTVVELYAATAGSTGYVPLIMRGDRNATLKVSSTLGAGNNYFILVNYEEE